MPVQLPAASTFIALPKGFSGCQTLLCPCAGQARRAGEFVPPPGNFPPSVNDDSCQINTPTPLSSMWKNSEMFAMDTRRVIYLVVLGSSLPTTEMCWMEQKLLGFFPSLSYFSTPLPGLSGILFQINFFVYLNFCFRVCFWGNPNEENSREIYAFCTLEHPSNNVQSSFLCNKTGNNPHAHQQGHQ